MDNKSLELAQCMHAAADFKCRDYAFYFALQPNEHSEMVPQRYRLRTKPEVAYGVQGIPVVKNGISKMKEVSH